MGKLMPEAHESTTTDSLASEILCAAEYIQEKNDLLRGYDRIDLKLIREAIQELSDTLLERSESQQEDD